MNSILMSISPYWGFLIIAEDRGWDLAKYGLHKKIIEARKRIPTSSAWDRNVALYFTKDKKSLQQIPKEYRDEVAKLCGKVIGEFVCDEVREINVFDNGSIQYWNAYNLEDTCVAYEQLARYIGYDNKGYGLHISELKIYDKPKELSEFRVKNKIDIGWDIKTVPLFRPPQSWCYVEEL